MECNRNRLVINLLQLVHAAERLKFTLRHGWTSNGRQESVADHSWRLSLMVILCYPYLDAEIDLEKTLQMAILHDLPEIIVGDIPFFEALEGSLEKQQKYTLENEAMKDICSRLEREEELRLFSLWKEYQSGESREARFLRALDKIEAQIQQNEADISTWNEFEKRSIFDYLDKFCDYDSFLSEFKAMTREESIKKLYESTLT
jgi:putative hydrolases of HD superfamily